MCKNVHFFQNLGDLGKTNMMFKGMTCAFLNVVVIYTAHSYCSSSFTATAKMVLFYVSAGFFIAGFMIILVGLMCKVGKLHRHFHNKSYEILEGRDAMSPHM